jgi:hypothetical protein
MLTFMRKYIGTDDKTAKTTSWNVEGYAKELWQAQRYSTTQKERDYPKLKIKFIDNHNNIILNKL